MQLNVSRLNQKSSRWQTANGVGTTTLRPGKWVSLRESVSPFSHDEALLLCRVAETTWCVWVPGHGEATLETSQFRS